jgi:hypothetical protein
MSTPIQPKPNPVPAILVYGTPTSPALTQASWFRPEDKEAVKAAAEALKFSVIELQTDADRALAAGAHEGVLKGSGRMVVGSVSSEVYRRIEEHVRKAAGASDASRPENAAAATTKPVSEQNTNIGAAGPSSPGPSRATLAAPEIDKPDSANARETLRVRASFVDAVIQRSTSSGVVRMTGMALAWIGATTAFASVVKKANRSLVVSPSLTFRTDVQRVQTPAKNWVNCSRPIHAAVR